jgi:phosphonate transport system substrate-binding protein
MAPHLVSRVKVIAFTDAVPNSGLVASPRVTPDLIKRVTQALKTLHDAVDGPFLLEQLFQMDEFEDAPKLGYHALYRLAVASL